MLSAGVIDLYQKTWQQNEPLYPIYCWPEGSVGAFGDNSYILPTGKNATQASMLAYRIGTPESKWLRNQLGYMTAYGHTDDPDPGVCCHDRLYPPEEAYLPEGCTVFRNPVGTAPGCVFTAGKTTAALLPGVPHECRYMAEHCLLPWLEQVRGQTVRSHTLHIFGLTEPQVQELLDDLLRREADMTLAPYAKPGEVMLQLSARGADERACEARMAPVLAEVRARLGAYFYGVDVSGLEETVLTLCRERGLTLAAAESCTGGLIAKRLTDIPGASQVFLGGVVSYTNHVKQQVLHVPENLLARCGAVSAEVARAMALGVRVLTGADLAVSVTGLAGPDGDDRGNPVGTVFVGLSAPEGVTVRHLTLGGDRERIRTLSAHHAFDMLRRYLTNLPTEGE